MANPWQEAAESMKGTGVSNLGQSYAPTFTPNLVSNPWGAVDDISMNYDVSFPSQDMSDRFDYGYGQMVGNMTNQDGSIDPWRYRDNDYHVNPDIFANIYGGGPDGPHNRGAKLLAEQYNNPSVTNNFAYAGPQQDVLDIVAFNNALQGGEIDVDPMYMDEDMTYDISDPELYMTQEAQVADEPNAFISTLMENYGRGNPFVQNLGGTYNDYFGETWDMDTDQVGLRPVVGDWQNYAADNADMIENRQLLREMQNYPDPILNMVEEERSMPNYEDFFEDFQGSAIQEPMYEGANLGNYDLFHLMQNGYSLEEAQAILTEQGLA